jgi:lipoprotein-releasing system permease protein
LSWRKIRSHKGKSLSFMTTFSILGVAIGVAALTIVLSVMGGFEQDLVGKMFKGLPHLEIIGENPLAGFSLKEHPLATFEQLFHDTRGVEPFTQADVVVKNRKNLASITLLGIDPHKGGSLWGFSQGMISGKVSYLEAAPEAQSGGDELPGIIFGDSLALQLNAEMGDEVMILSPQAGISSGPLNGSPLARKFRVVGIFMTDLPKYDSRFAVVALPEGRKFLIDYEDSLDGEEYVSGIAVNLNDPSDVDSYAARLSAFPQLSVTTWKVANKSLLFALKLEKFTMGAILLLIVLVAVFSISATLMMTVYHQQSQISIMRSLGMRQTDISNLFLIHGGVIGFLGVVFGMLVGLGVCTLLYYFQFINLPDGVYYQEKLPVKFLPLEYGVICISAWALSVMAAVYPAIIAAKQDPGSGLRSL